MNKAFIRFLIRANSILFVAFACANSELPSAANASSPSNVYDRLNQKSLSLSSHQTAAAAMALLAAGASFGAYKYHQTYIASTPEIIDTALNFVINSINNPIFCTTQSDYIRGSEDYLSDQKDLILRALGLKISYLNAASYLKKSNYTFSENPYVNKLFYQEYETIDDFFKSLSKLSSKDPYELLNPFLELELKKEISDKATDVYISLLKAKSKTPPEVERNKRFISPQDFLESSKLSAIDNALIYVLTNETFNILQPDYIFPDSVKYNAESIIDAFNILKNYWVNLEEYTPQGDRQQHKDEIVKKLKNDSKNLKEKLFGSWIYRTVVEFASAQKSSNDAALEKTIDGLYGAFINIAIGEGDFDNDVSQKMLYVFFSIARTLPEIKKIEIIKDFYKKSIEKKYSYTPN